MGVKTRARLTQERTVRLRYAQLLSLSSSVRGKLIKIMGVTGSKGQRENVKSGHAHFCDGSNTPARAVGGRKKATAHIGGEPFALGSVAHEFSLPYGGVL